MRDDAPVNPETCFDNALCLAERLIDSMPDLNQDRLHLRFHAGGGSIKRGDVLPYDAQESALLPGQNIDGNPLITVRGFLEKISDPLFMGSASIYFAREDGIVTVRKIEYYQHFKLDLPRECLQKRFH